MSRNNVFKLSGNMALGSNDAYSNSDFENIKSSLKLLKSKQTQRQQNMPLEPTVPHFRPRIITEHRIHLMHPLDNNPIPKVSHTTYRSSIQWLPKQL